MNTNWIHRYSTVWLTLIVLLGFALRLGGIYWGQAYSRFEQGDGIEAFSVAVDYGRGETRAEYIGQPNYNEHSKLPGPLWAIWCFLCLRTGGSIYGVLWGTMLLNSALVYLTYLLAERTVGPKAGLWAALFAATLPWAVYFSVGVYNPNLMGFLGVLLYLALWRTVQNERSRSIAWVGILLLAMPQVHMSGLMLVPAVVLILMLSPVRLSVSWLVAGLIAGLALYLPYIRGEMAHSWQNTHGMLSGKGGRTWDSLKTLTVPPGLLINLVPSWQGSMAEYREMARAWCGSFVFLLGLNLVSGIMAALIIWGSFAKVRAAAIGMLSSPRQCFRRSPAIIFLAVMVFIPLLFSLISGRPFLTRYCLVLLAPFLALAGAAAASWSEGSGPAQKPALRRMFLASAVITTCANLWLVPAMYLYQGNMIQRGEVFIPSWQKLELVYQALKAQAGSERSVQVDDTAYLAALPRGENLERKAVLIRRYVAVREREYLMRAGQSKPPMIFKLAKADQQTEARAAYTGQGIALISSGTN